MDEAQGEALTALVLGVPPEVEPDDPAELTQPTHHPLHPRQAPAIRESMGHDEAQVTCSQTERRSMVRADGDAIRRHKGPLLTGVHESIVASLRRVLTSHMDHTLERR